MKFAIGDTVRHKTGLIGEVIGVIRHKRIIKATEYFVEYPNGRCFWSLEGSLVLANVLDNPNGPPMPEC